MTHAELAVLSLVAERPRHGYEIEQVIEERGMREWTEIGFSSIYYLLKKLEREGVVASTLTEAARGPARKVYHVTPAGKEALRAGLLEALSVPHHPYPPLQLGMANLPFVPLTEALSALRQYHGRLEERLAELRKRRADQQPRPYHVDAMFDYSETMIQAEMAWVARFTAQLEAQ